jgi:uncharacterized protein (TIGR03437 family)
MVQAVHSFPIRCILALAVSITVGANTATPQSIVVTSASSLNFVVPLGTVNYTPTSQTVQITASDGSHLPFSFLGIVPNSVNPANYLDPQFLAVSPTSGTTPATVTVSPVPFVTASLTCGGYPVTMSFGSSPDIRVGSTSAGVTTSNTRTPVISAIVHGATFQPGPLSPNEVVSIFGTNLGPYPAPPAALSIGIPFYYYSLGFDGLKITFNGRPAPILYSSSGQINTIVPSEVAGATTADVALSFCGASAAPLQFPVVAAVPGIFSANASGNGQGLILNQNNKLNNESNPAPKGSVVQIFGTGGGAVSPANATDGQTVLAFGSNPYPATVAPTTVTIGGVPATVTYSGAAPNQVYGVLQVNAIVPATVASGPQPVALTIGPNTNNQNITLVVQ